MHVSIVTPAPRGSRKGNRVTAERWARLLRELGHRVTVGVREPDARASLLLALHARRSGRAVAQFVKQCPGCPIVVALTGTDLYGDVPRGDPIALRSLELAHRLLVLQPDALRFLPKVHADKARVIPQSVTPLSTPPTPRRRSFDIAVVGHFRHVKDPMRTAMASRRLPPTSRIAVLHAGSILDAHFKDKIERETEMSSRYHWLGELSPARALRLIARSRGLVVSSRAEGGAHVVSEALVVETPILATAISGNIGMLGADYPGLFPVGDTKRLTELLIALETNTAFRDQLIERGRALAPTYSPLNERKCLAALIAGLDPAAS